MTPINHLVRLAGALGCPSRLITEEVARLRVWRAETPGVGYEVVVGEIDGVPWFWAVGVALAPCDEPVCAAGEVAAVLEDPAILWWDAEGACRGRHAPSVTHQMS
ncbi:hypothetical protein [Actinomadura macrotermitis]|uniref:Uncharacterized protein n=1 Tax=Actinomadura macrotermitis TaxID=2585200 RepID=A0A7K0BMY4_9ACTN|nr:hypothetical protein [Actinomadura macrotermitis]MQY02537.1 hypothetical protein [Actinomadura macrotermitis]